MEQALQIRDDGIWGRVEWSQAARNMIAAREYRTISPVLIHTLQDGRVIKIQGASLVHRHVLPRHHRHPAHAPAPDPAKYVPIAAVVELMSERNSTMALLSEREATTMVDDAVIGGTITPAMRPWAVALCTQDPASFKSFMASSAPAYAHFFKGHEFAPLDVPDAAPATDVAMMAEQLGLDRASFG